MPRLLKDKTDDDTEEYTVEGDFENITRIQGDLDEHLEQIFSEFGGGEESDEYLIRAYRTQNNKGKLGYLFSCSMVDLPILDKLRDEYKGGDFEIRVIKNKKIFTRRIVCVEPPPETGYLDRENTEHQKNTELTSVMVNGFTKLGELFTQSQNVQTHVSGMKEMVESMVAMKQLFPEPVLPPPITDIFGQLKNVIEVSKLIKGKDTGAETNLNDVLLSLADTVLPKLVESAEENETLKKLPSTREPAKKGKVNPMKSHLIFLCMQAKADKDTLLYANIVIDNTPESAMNDLKAFMELPDCIEKMGEIHGNVLNYKDWFTELIEDVLSLFQADDKITDENVLTNNESTTINPDIDVNNNDVQNTQTDGNVKHDT